MEEGRKEEGNERAERLIIRRKGKCCKEEEGRTKRGDRNQRIKSVVIQKGRNADSFLLMCSGTGIDTVEVSSENFSVFKRHIWSHCTCF